MFARQPSRCRPISRLANDRELIGRFVGPKQLTNRAELSTDDFVSALTDTSFGFSRLSDSFLVHTTHDIPRYARTMTKWLKEITLMLVVFVALLAIGAGVLRWIGFVELPVVQ